MRLSVNKKDCIGCGLCCQVCPSKKINILEGKAEIDDTCMKCGHCYSVCPENAVFYSEVEKIEETKLLKLSDAIKAEDFLATLKTRRSQRLFVNSVINDEQINMLIEAANCAPTASNSHNVRYLVIKDSIDQLTNLVMDVLKDKAVKMREQGGLNSLEEYYANKWINMKEEYLNQGIDRLFFHAPLVISFVSNSLVNASISASQVNLMADAMGLGACYVGFVSVASDDERLKKYMGLKVGEQVVCTLAIGKPKTKFLRQPVRAKADITWL